jgi:hypothetical protein
VGEGIPAVLPGQSHLRVPPEAALICPLEARREEGLGCTTVPTSAIFLQKVLLMVSWSLLQLPRRSPPGEWAGARAGVDHVRNSWDSVSMD